MTKTVMLVDDEIGVHALVSIMLRRSGFTVVTAENASEALNLLESETPDLFVLDMMLPDMDGLELCEQIRARPDTSKIPVIMLSARYDQDSIERAYQAGATEYLYKLNLSRKLVPTVCDILLDQQENRTG